MAKIKIKDLPRDQKISKTEMKGVLGGKGSSMDFSIFSAAAYKFPGSFVQMPRRYAVWDKSSGRNTGMNR